MVKFRRDESTPRCLGDLTALADLKSEGGILERPFLLLKEHVIKGRLVGASSLEGVRRPLLLKKIGALSEEHAKDVDGKVAEILRSLRESGGGSVTLPGPPTFSLPPSARERELPPNQDPPQAASHSTEASGKGSGPWRTPWAVILSTVGQMLPASR